ncbi:hypothetical protein NB311A_12961 [Nitrobacter sp. Nb-311A]|nr:hypothetical protein NB311A_12961 [Nitrobacter sp. Nb-311A]
MPDSVDLHLWTAERVANAAIETGRFRWLAEGMH